MNPHTNIVITSFLLLLFSFVSPVSLAGETEVELIDDFHRPLNYHPGPWFELYNWKNEETLKKLYAFKNPDTAKWEAHMRDTSINWETRLLYAVVLSVHNENSGKRYLLEQFDVIEPRRYCDLFSAIKLLAYAQKGMLVSQDDSHMEWAKEAMLSAMSNESQVVPDYYFSGTEGPSYSVRQLAVKHGSFERILRASNDPRLIAALSDYIIDDMKEEKIKALFSDFSCVHVMKTLSRMVGPEVESVIRQLPIKHGRFELILRASNDPRLIAALSDYIIDNIKEEEIKALFTDYSCVHVMRTLSSMDGPEVESVMQQVAIKGAKAKSIHYQGHAEAVKWLIARDDETMVTVIHHALRHTHVFWPLVGTDNVEYLEAIENVVRNGEGLTDDLKIRNAVAHGRLLIIMSKAQDPVSELMRFAEDPNAWRQPTALILLRRFDDPRIIPWALEYGKTNSNWYTPFAVTKLISSFKNDEALIALRALNRHDFANIQFEPGYTVERYRKHITEAIITLEEEQTEQKSEVTDSGEVIDNNSTTMDTSL